MRERIPHLPFTQMDEAEEVQPPPVQYNIDLSRFFYADGTEKPEAEPAAQVQTDGVPTAGNSAVAGAGHVSIDQGSGRLHPSALSLGNFGGRHGVLLGHEAQRKVGASSTMSEEPGQGHGAVAGAGADEGAVIFGQAAQGREVIKLGKRDFSAIQEDGQPGETAMRLGQNEGPASILGQHHMGPELEERRKRVKVRLLFCR
ncbi:unnamed protein product [Discosporangium mesarthrocarpum]